MNNELKGERPHIPALDGLRAIAVLLVFHDHVWVTVVTSTRLTALAPFDRHVLRVFAAGWVGVDLFFVLSGFLITGILLDAKGGRNYFRAFYARRVLRIFPAYYGFVILLLILARWRDAPYVTIFFENINSHQLWFWLYVSNIPASFPELIQLDRFPALHLWTLAVEEQFYIVWPLVVLALSRRGLIATSASLFLVAFLFRVIATNDAASSWSAPASTTYYFTLAKADTLAIGALLACLVRDPAIMRRVRIPGTCAVTGAFAVLVTLGVWHTGLPPVGTDILTVGLTALAILFAGAVFFAATASRDNIVVRLLSTRPLTSIGRYSYTIYLIHVIVLGEAGAWVLARGGFPAWGGHEILPILLFDVVTFAITYGLAWLSWHLIESQILKLKRFFPYGDSAISANGRESVLAEA